MFANAQLDYLFVASSLLLNVLSISPFETPTIAATSAESSADKRLIRGGTSGSNESNALLYNPSLSPSQLIASSVGSSYSFITRGQRGGWGAATASSNESRSHGTDGIAPPPQHYNDAALFAALWLMLVVLVCSCAWGFFTFRRLMVHCDQLQSRLCACEARLSAVERSNTALAETVENLNKAGGELVRRSDTVSSSVWRSKISTVTADSSVAHVATAPGPSTSGGSSREGSGVTDDAVDVSAVSSVTVTAAPSSSSPVEERSGRDGSGSPDILWHSARFPTPDVSRSGLSDADALDVVQRISLSSSP